MTPLPLCHAIQERALRLQVSKAAKMLGFQATVALLRITMLLTCSNKGRHS